MEFKNYKKYIQKMEIKHYMVTIQVYSPVEGLDLRMHSMDIEEVIKRHNEHSQQGQIIKLLEVAEHRFFIGISISDEYGTMGAGKTVSTYVTQSVVKRLTSHYGWGDFSERDKPKFPIVNILEYEDSE